MEKVEGNRHHDDGHSLCNNHVALYHHAPLQGAPLASHGVETAFDHVVDSGDFHIFRAQSCDFLKEPGLELLL